ncbi:MAG TPA: HPr-rel-A system PqqD family peptide chaperone [Steroidobacteraceae bacterium]|nr:HPr-rel-A system PqqD family peptide chaperone [Steroidobacteraceae bacterium]HQX79853.1 HPr-rel-A system PqqD family peptide chaperone [Steroidobacteraceae bacterium]HQZ81549.1 HPr-rel-A system PqqD family peptide chaperone [Steroidobacteraceae bacterium]
MASTTPTSEPKWRRADAAHCVWADWDELSVVYHRPSGKTHFVNASTAFLLEQLLGEPASVESAAQALAQAQDRPVDDALRDDVAGTLLRLAELGLIESA